LALFAICAGRIRFLLQYPAVGRTMPGMSLLLAVNSPLSDQTAWYAVGAVGLIALYLMMRPKKQKDPRFGVPSFPLTRQRDVEQQMSNLLVELADMARQITAQLDTRAAKLEVLMKEADDKLRELRAAFPSAPGTGRSEIDSAPLERAAIERPIAAAIAPPHAMPAPLPVDLRHAEVYALADEGRPAAEIARRLARPAGEIELILALRPR
jgi:hypothetical protein